MRITTLIAAALVAVSGSAFAAGYEDEIVVIPPQVPVEPAETGSMGSLGSLGGGAASVLLPLGLIAAVAAAGEDDDECTGTTGECD